MSEIPAEAAPPVGPLVGGAPPEPEVPPEPPTYNSADESADAMSRAIAALDAQSEEPEAPGAPDSGGEIPTPDPEAPPAEEVEAAPEGDPPPTSDDYAALADERAAFEAERQAFAAERQAAQADPRLAALDLLATKPQAALEALGTSYNEITARILGQAKEPQAPAADPLAAEMQALKAQVETFQRQQAVSSAAANARTALADPGPDPERWGLLKNEPGWDSEVVKYIEDAWVRGGSRVGPDGAAVGALRFDEAADSLEKYLFEQATRYTSPKVRKHYGAATQPPSEPGQQATPADPSAATVPPTATLSTAHASTAAPLTDTSDPGACRARALAALEQQE